MDRLNQVKCRWTGAQALKIHHLWGILLYAI
jgi:hypothetical protein